MISRIKASGRSAQSRPVLVCPRPITAIAFVLILGCLTGPGQAFAAEPGDGVVPEQPLLLFNGTNLAGFHTWLVDTQRKDPRQVFTVTNNQLRISGDGLGYLATEKSYRDYELIVEFRWGSTNSAWGERTGKARDSGVFLHATGPDGNSHDGRGAFMAAIECQIMEGAMGDLLLIRGTAADGSLIAPQVTVEVDSEAGSDADGWPFWKPGGSSRTITRWGRVNRQSKSRVWRDEFGFTDRAGFESLAGGWNRLVCRCDGDRIQVTLNGRLVNAVSKVSPRHGRILLQCEGSEMFMRRLELQPVRWAAR
jgi:hypothetical protein